MSRAILRKVADALVDEAIELVPIAIQALQEIIQGRPPAAALTRAQRNLLAAHAQKRMDEALKRSARNPKPKAKK